MMWRVSSPLALNHVIHSCTFMIARARACMPLTFGCGDRKRGWPDPQPASRCAVSRHVAATCTTITALPTLCHVHAHMHCGRHALCAVHCAACRCPSRQPSRALQCCCTYACACCVLVITERPYGQTPMPTLTTNERHLGCDIMPWLSLYGLYVVTGWNISGVSAFAAVTSSVMSAKCYGVMMNCAWIEHHASLHAREAASCSSSLSRIWAM